MLQETESGNVWWKKSGMTRKLQEATESTYKACSCLVGAHHEKGEWSGVTAAVKQGSVLPLLLVTAHIWIALKTKMYKERLRLQGQR